VRIPCIQDWRHAIQLQLGICTSLTRSNQHSISAKQQARAQSTRSRRTLNLSWLAGSKSDSGNSLPCHAHQHLAPTHPLYRLSSPSPPAWISSSSTAQPIIDRSAPDSFLSQASFLAPQRGPSFCNVPTSIFIYIITLSRPKGCYISSLAPRMMCERSY